MCRTALFVAFLSLFCHGVHSAVNGGWGAWSHWSGWAKGQCSGNQRVRTRPCTSPMPSTDGEYCVGDNAINQLGSVDGGWSDWAQWSSCSKPCGGSTVNRTRLCNSPTAERGGAQCVGSSIETKLECLSKCPDGRVDGGYGQWTSWSPCLKTCSTTGGSRITRSRQCNSPPPMNGGSSCKGPSVERVMSCFNSCPVNGGFGQWSAWTECTKTCGTGTQERRRLCNNPEPMGNGARNCTGAFKNTRNCKFADCLNAVNGSWSAWSFWSQCSSTYCMKGEKSRTRTCNNPPPKNDGDTCPGSGRETKACPSSNCQTYVPTLAPTSPVFPHSYMARECGVNVKYRHSTPTGHRVPSAVFTHLAFKANNFRNGYFNYKDENGGKEIKYCFDPEPALTIKDVVDSLLPSYRRTLPFLGYEKPSDESQPITGFYIKVKNEAGYAPVEYDLGIEFRNYFSPGQNVEMRNVSITYNSNGAKRSFMAKGDYYRFNPTIFKSAIYRYAQTTHLVGTAPSMKIQHWFNFLGILKVPSFVESALRGIKVWDFEFGPVSIGYDFLQGWMESLTPFRFTATKRIDGIPVHLEIIASLKGTRWIFAIGFMFDGESFGAAMGKLSGAKLADGGFFDSVGVQVEAGIMLNVMDGFKVSPHATAFTKEPIKSWTSSSVPKGLIVVAQIGLPKDCGGSSFCRVTKKILGPDVKFAISAFMDIKFTGINIVAGFYKIRLTDEVSFSRLELLISFNRTEKSTTLGFRAEVKFPVKSGEVFVDGFKVDNYLYVGGQITHKLGTVDVNGMLYMRGLWRNAFGSDWFSIGDIVLGITISADSPIGVSGLQIGGRLEFGKNCLYSADFDLEGHCIKVRIYFGIGKQNFFYGEVSALTVGKVIRMLGGDTGAVPGPVAETGFPKGALVSYNAGKDAVNLAIAGGPIIPVGVRVKGILNLFGYEIRVDIRIGDMEIYIDGECDPINLGGVLLITRNNTHLNLGPKLFFQYRPKEASLIKLPFFKMFYEGYGKFFGIEAYAFINITMQGMEIYIWGKAWDLVYAELYISAGYDVTNIRNAHFYVRVIIDLRGLTQAIENARKSVDRAFKAAQKTLNDAIEDVKRAKRRCKEKLKLKCSNCYSLKCAQAEKNCKGFLNDAKKWIGGVINAAGNWIKNTAKKIKDGLASVGKKIKKFFSGWRRRRSLISQRNENFDLHVRNRRFISKLLCEGLVGGGCKGVSHLCYGSCKAVDYIGQGLCNVVDIAVGALRLAEKVVGWVNSAIQFVLQMFLLHGIRFELGLGHRFGGGFMVAAEIDLTLFGNRMQFGFQFDLNNPGGSVTSASDSGMYNYKQGVKQARTTASFDPYDPPNPFTDFDLAGTFGIESTQTGGEVRLGACLAVIDKREHTRLVLTGCNDTDAKQQWAFTLKGSLVNSHSKFCINLEDVEDRYITQRKCKDNKDDQKYECDIATRSFKRRRSNKCVAAAGLTTPNGPGSLSHLGSLKCINVNSRNQLILRSECQTTSTEWKLENGILRNIHTGYCVRPVGGNAVAGARLEIANSGCHKFAFTQKGSLQHINKRLCVQTSNKKMIPNDYTHLILGTQCDYVKNSASLPAFPDPQMVFSFIPTNKYLKMQRCNDFNDLKMEQRFEVRNEELASICTKFAPDIALKKTAVQSSTNHNGFASRAVDGNYKFHWSSKSCTHTKNERDPWWRVDLGKETIVTDVTIINRGEHGDRLKSIQVHIGNNEQNNKANPVCHDRVRSAANGEALRLQCNPPIPGRYVSVQMYGSGILTLCEVMVNSRIGGLADYCQLENGGCDQLCFNHCDKKTTCGCLPGYSLAYDQKTCIDVNECLVNNGGCRRDTKASCVNYPGGFYCDCDPGYILKDDSLTECVDFNECGVQNGGCEQMCSNTHGGYSCECRAGFKPKKLYGCEDINECLTSNGGCEHICSNYHGGRLCKCRPGYRLTSDGKSCEEIYCRALEAPVRGSITPSTCTERFANIRQGTACRFNCHKGFEIVRSQTQDSLTCRIDGTWNHASPSCHPVKCGRLTRPKNGGIVPPNCATGTREFGQRCVVYCKHGYRLSGPATKYCQSDKSWSNNAPNECVKIIGKPYLNCPADIQVTLGESMSSIQLGYRFPEPQTNMRITSVSHSRDHSFRVGSTVVKFEAVNEEGVRKSCQVLVDVRDVTPPKVNNCPQDIIEKIYTTFTVVTWTKPTFTDAVGVAQVEESHIAPGRVWTVGQSAVMQYRAYDASGNTAKCKFTVSVKSLTCTPLTGDKYASVYPYSVGVSYQAYCTNQRAFFGPYGQYGELAYCSQGDYFIQGNNIGLTLPSCVEYTASNANAKCPIGSQKFTSSDWFGNVFYKCYKCPAGKYRDSSSSSCKECQIGFYQDDQGMSECEPCGEDTSTAHSGSTSISQCIAKCRAGTFSGTGLDISPKGRCTPCPKGTFSDVNGTTECVPCPTGTTTQSFGASHESACFNVPKLSVVLPGAQISEKSGETVSIYCLFQGIIMPEPTTTWTKIGGSLPATAVQKDALNLDMKKVGMVLIIANVSPSHSGTYQCSVRNFAGADSKTAQVTVT